MDHDQAEAVALHRFGVIAEATNPRLTPAEPGVVVRAIAARAHPHPDGTDRRYSRATIDRWIRAWRAGGLAALRPAERADVGTVRAHPELFAEVAALRLDLPSRSAAQIASILFHRHGVRVAERTVRAQLRRAGLHREALQAEPKVFSRYEAEAPNDRWITDVLVGPWVPWPRTDPSVRARLFLIVDDHSRLIVDGRSSPMRTPGPARSCCAGRSCAAACPSSCMPIMPTSVLCRCWVTNRCRVRVRCWQGRHDQSASRKARRAPGGR